jgi:hypothetical protein
LTAPWILKLPCHKFNYTVDPIRGRHSNLEHVNYYSTPLDKYIECDFSEFMAEAKGRFIVALAEEIAVLLE